MHAPNLLATQKPFFIIKDEINTVKMQSPCTIDYYYIAQTCHGVGGFTSVINPLHIYINRNNYFITFKYLTESVVCLLLRFITLSTYYFSHIANILYDLHDLFQLLFNCINLEFLTNTSSCMLAGYMATHKL